MNTFLDESPTLSYNEAIGELCGLYSICSRSAGAPAEHSERIRGAVDMVSAIYSVNAKDVLTDMRAELLLQNIEFDEDELR